MQNATLRHLIIKCAKWGGVKKKKRKRKPCILGEWINGLFVSEETYKQTNTHKRPQWPRVRRTRPHNAMPSLRLITLSSQFVLPLSILCSDKQMNKHTDKVGDRQTKGHIDTRLQITNERKAAVPLSGAPQNPKKECERRRDMLHISLFLSLSPSLSVLAFSSSSSSSTTIRSNKHPL